MNDNIDNNNLEPKKPKIKFAEIANYEEDKKIRMIAKGTHKEFTIDDITVVALNLKNAIKKVQKIKKFN